MVFSSAKRGTQIQAGEVLTTRLAQRMEDIIIDIDIDIDTGAVISSGSTIEEMGDALLERLVEVASGQLRTKAELFGQDDFITWKRGVSLR
jgi:altronate hydrolase